MTDAALAIRPEIAAAILDERTALLATPRNADAVAARDVLPVLIVAAGGDRYALPSRMLAGILPGRELHPLPVRHAAMIGALYERGDIWTVYSLAAIAGSGKADDAAGRIVLLEQAGRRAAVRVGAVDGLAEIDRATLSDIRDGGSAPGSAVVRLATRDGLMVIDETTLSDLLRLSLGGLP